MRQDPDSMMRPRRLDPMVVLAGLLGMGVLWAYWPTLREMAKRWSTDPRYAHGYLVPAFALVLLWLRRDQLAALAPRPSCWGGLALIGAALALRLAGAYFYLGWFEAVSLLPALAGLCVLVWGWGSLRWSWPAIAFLVFMLPLPFRLEGALAYPLQRVATKVSTYALETLGFPAVAEGNVIHMEDVEIGVVEACSGLSMLFTFFAMATGVVLVIRRPWLDKILIVASAIPIALIVNMTRITVTGVLHETVGSRLAELVFHDLAGWLMMPMALGLLWLELELLARLLVEPAPPAAALKPIGLVGAIRASRDLRESGEGHRREVKQDATAAAQKPWMKNP
jgi:exosortase